MMSLKRKALPEDLEELRNQTTRMRLKVATMSMEVTRMQEKFANEVTKELHELTKEVLVSNERWTELKEETGELNIMMVNMTHENDALKAAVAKLQKEVALLVWTYQTPCVGIGSFRGVNVNVC